MHADAATSSLPLRGIKIVEFTHMVMGPAVGAILVELGAEVVRIEPIGGDSTRNLKGSGAGYFPMYNRNKKSLCLDLKSKEGLAIARKLCGAADVVIENFRNGAMDKLGLGYEALSADNPGLIYCSEKGFLSGPYENRTALDEVTQMMGGLAYMTGLPDRPMRAGSSVIDITGGMFGVIAILSALHRRQTSGEGCHVTSALFETTAFFVGQHMAQQAVSGEAPPPMSVRQSAWAIYDIFDLDSGDRLFVGIVSDTLWQKFCEEFAQPSWAADASLATNQGRVTARETLLPAIRALFAPMSLTALCERLERAGLPFAPINRPGDLFDDPHLRASGGLLGVNLTDGERSGERADLPGLPIEFGSAKPALRHNLPAVGAHSHELLIEAGLSEEVIASLVAEGVLNA